MAQPKPKTGYPNSSGLYRITAPIATRLLASEPIRQRVPTSGRIDMYARDIVNDRWEINGETVKIATSKAMIDGQNRMLALLKAAAEKTGAYIDTWVICDLDANAAMMSIDTGKSRTLSDVLKILDTPYTTMVSSLLRATTAYETQLDLYRPTVTIFECMETYNRRMEPVLFSSQRVWNHFKLFSRASAGFIHLSGCLNGKQEEAETFLGGLLHGLDLSENSPIHTLREHLIQWQNNRVHYSRTLGWNDVLPYYIKAWNAYCAGQDLPVIGFKRGMEDWPRLVEDPHRTPPALKRRPKLKVVSEAA